MFALGPETFAKVAVTPVLITAAARIQRVAGPRAGGFVVGLPLTSAPVVAFITADHGPAFASRVAIGVLLGLVAEAVFLASYAWVALIAPWPGALACAAAAYAAAAIGLTQARAGLVIAAAGAFAAVALAGLLLRLARRDGTTLPPRVGGVVARAIVATVAVVALTAASGVLGPRVTGVLAPVPVYAGVVVVFTHRESGPQAASAASEGVVDGLIGFVAFFAVVGALLPAHRPVVAFACAVVASIVVLAGGAAARDPRRLRRRWRGESA